MPTGSMTSARSIRIRGIVQGVGFRPFVSRLARSRDLAGWVVNDDRGVEIHLEGGDQAIETFVRELDVLAPPAARIAAIDVERVAPVGFHDFTIRDSRRQVPPSVAISPDLPVCEACLRELFDPLNRRHGYPYINCTQCGPRFSLVLGLPYDRARTTMREWTMDPDCMSEYGDAANRRFHAQPLACHACGPGYRLEESDTSVGGAHAVQRAADLLNAGHILAVKGVGGFHLACDARNARAIAALRARK